MDDGQHESLVHQLTVHLRPVKLAYESGSGPGRALNFYFEDSGAPGDKSKEQAARFCEFLSEAYAVPPARHFVKVAQYLTNGHTFHWVSVWPAHIPEGSEHSAKPAFKRHESGNSAQEAFRQDFADWKETHGKHIWLSDPNTQLNERIRAPMSVITAR